MKCAYHPEVDAVGACVECGRPLCSTCPTFLEGKTYCQPCANKVFARKGEKRSRKLVAGGILGIISGLGGLIAGSALIHDGASPEWWESTVWAEIGVGIGWVIVGLVAIVGSSYAIARMYFGLALAGGISALSVPLLGIPALILIALSKDEFQPVRLPGTSICARCGRENLPSSKFCDRCGSELIRTVP